MLWDNGADFLDRASHTWRDPVAKDIIINAAKGVINSLPDSTEDSKATSQTSSAYIFHRVGQPVLSQTLSFKLNGNTIKSVKGSATPLTSPADYSISGSSILFTQSFLSNQFSPTGKPGIKANLTVSFSAGADLQIQIVQWDVPSLSGGSITSKATPGKDLQIPITWKGIEKPAAVKALSSDGKFLVDDWTQYLGPMQAGHAVSWVLLLNVY
jgi:endoglucanase